MLKRRSEVTIAKFSISFNRIEQVNKSSNLYILWKRGKKKENQGKTESFTIDKDGSAIIGQSIEFECTLLKSGKKYDDKYLSIALKDV